MILLNEKKISFLIFTLNMYKILGAHYTPQPLYNTIVWVQANFRVSYSNRVITRVKCIVI